MNPLLEPQQIALRNGLVRTGGYEDLLNEAGEVSGVSVIHKRRVLDDEHFVKMFAAGVAASFELGKTAQKVLGAVLGAYQRAPLRGGYCDWLELFWFGDGLDGEAVEGMSEKTFQRGLKELLARGFLSPRSPTTFWTNPHLFFKGNRAVFISEYVRAAGERATEGAELPEGIVKTEVPY